MSRPLVTESARPPPQANAALSPVNVIAPGVVLGRVQIVGRLGSGGMADVWLGRISGHGGFARLVAVKTVHAMMCRDASARAMFLREAELAASIRHANVVDVHDVGEAEGVLYLVMSLVEGDTFAALHLCAGQTLPLGVSVSVIGDALLGLHAAHEAVDENGNPRRLVHRDVSPQNILVGLDGVARVSDFGIAKALAQSEESTVTLRGKCGYFSPEQAQQAPLDRRSDVFSMGIVLWEALVGQRLFRQVTLVDTLSRVIRGPIPDPRELNPRVPAPLAAVTLRALSRGLDQRYPTAEAMAQDLTRAARESVGLVSRAEVARTIEMLTGPAVRARIAGLRASPTEGPAPASPFELSATRVEAAEDARTFASHEVGPRVAGSGQHLLEVPPQEHGGARRPARMALLALLGLVSLAAVTTVVFRREVLSRVAAGSVASAPPPPPATAGVADPSTAKPVGAPADTGGVAPATASISASASTSPGLPVPPAAGSTGSRRPADLRRGKPVRRAPFDDNPFDHPSSN